MWRTLASMLTVFVLWGLVLAGLVAVGAPPGPSELACAGGAGIMLVAVGLRIGRRAAHPVETTTGHEPEQRRASV